MSGYAEYREVNLPWLKAVPAHWEIRRNKNIFTEQKEIVGERSADYTLLSLTLNGIIPRDMDGGGKFPESFDKYKIVKNGIWHFAFLILTKRHAQLVCLVTMECLLAHTQLCALATLTPDSSIITILP